MRRTEGEGPELTARGEGGGGRDRSRVQEARAGGVGAGAGLNDYLSLFQDELKLSFKAVDFKENI